MVHGTLLGGLGVIVVVVIVNALPARDPSPDTTHTSMSFDVQWRVAQHGWELLRDPWMPVFKRILRDCFSIQDAPAGLSAIVSVAFWRRAGRHRSVASAVIHGRRVGDDAWLILFTSAVFVCFLYFSRVVYLRM